ncbi:hypothetical protein QS257_09345 [Terrilactibacillus sp. S3-3]|nr:hypothetical protein QS257_09345 [Terrilactibacillus sp. S3-3]
MKKHQIRGDLFRVLIFGLFYSIGTLDVNNVVLPYRVRRPYTIYASKRVALKHLLFAILYGFTPQLLIFSLFDLLLIIFGTYDIAIFLLLCVVLFYLSKLTSGIGLLTSTFFILGTGFGIYYNSYYLSFLCLILGYSIVWVIISVDFFYPSSKVEVFFQGFEKLQFKPQSIFAQMLHLLHREKIYSGFICSLLKLRGLLVEPV